MQAVMNILVTVNGARQAQAQLAGVQSQVKGMAGASAVMNATSAGMIGGLSRMTHGLERFGKNTQWVGRQIEYNFTLPIAIATGIASKWALENERASVRLQKVYGGNELSTQQFKE
jgi:hypothetical protein